MARTFLVCLLTAVCLANKIQPWLMDHAAGQDSLDFFVVLKARADLNKASSLQTQQLKGSFVVNSLRDVAVESQKPLHDLLRSENVQFQSFYIVNAILVRGASPALMQKLAARDDVLRVEGNPTIRAVAPLNVTDSPAPNAIEPGVTYIGAPNLWGVGVEGDGIVVAGMDTGIAWDVAALKQKYRGFNAQTGQVDHSYSWHDAVHSGGGRCGFNTKAPCDDNAHGTHTVGTVLGGEGTNSIGVAPRAKFIGCRNMNAGLGSPATYIECMEWALAPYPPGKTWAEGLPENAPHITTNSWGCPSSEGCSPDTLHEASEATRAAGILMVAAAGNSGSGCSTVSDTPSFEPSVFTVGAVSSSTGTLASFSSRGPTSDGRLKPEISAPGVGVRSCVPGGGYQSMSGTSMACPHVAGGLALLWSGFPGLRNDIPRTLDLLMTSASAVSSTACSSSEGVPNNLYGFGTLRVDNAYELALRASVSPVSLLIEEEGGSGVVHVTGLDPKANWKVTVLDPSWLSSSVRAGSGNAAVTITATKSTTGPRQGTVVVAGQRITVSQRDE